MRKSGCPAPGSHLGADAAEDRAAAIRRFEAANGLPVTGTASLALLGALLSAH